MSCIRFGGRSPHVCRAKIQRFRESAIGFMLKNLKPNNVFIKLLYTNKLENLFLHLTLFH